MAANYEQESLRREVNILIKEIGQIKKNKGDASELLAKKVEMDKKIAEGSSKVAELQKKRDLKAMTLGNIVDKDSAISLTEVSLVTRTFYERSNLQLTHQDDNPILRVWHPEPNHKGNTEPGLQLEDKTEGIISHHEVLTRLEAFDMDRGQSLYSWNGRSMRVIRLIRAQVSRCRVTEDTS